MIASSQSAGAAPPAGYLKPEEAAARLSELPGWPPQRSRRRIVQDIDDGKLRLWLLPEFVPYVPTPDRPIQLDFASGAVLEPSSVVALSCEPNGSIRMDSMPDMRLPAVIDETDIAALIAELAPRAPSPVVVVQQPIAPAPASGKRRGAPPQYDWDFVKTQVRRRIYRYGLPEKVR